MSASDNAQYPLHAFRFHVAFVEQMLESKEGAPITLCTGAFAECLGLEATMEPKVIKEGGRNWGMAQRAGPVTFGTVILKRGMTTMFDLWDWFEGSYWEDYAQRMRVTITMFNTAGVGQWGWILRNGMPIKFKAADLNAKGGSEVAVEELHIAHEGMLFTLDVPKTIPSA